MTISRGKTKNGIASKLFLANVYSLAFLNIMQASGMAPRFISILYSLNLRIMIPLLMVMFIYSWYGRTFTHVEYIMSGLILTQLGSFVLNGNLSFEGIYNIITWPLIFIVTYRLVYKDRLEIISKIGIIALIFAAAWLVYCYRNFLMNTIYYVYYIIVLIPFIMEIKGKRWFIITCNAAIAAITMWSYKRTGIVMVAMGIAAYYLIDIYVQKGNKRNLKVLLLMIGALAVLYWLFNYGDAYVVFRRFQNITDKSGSDRIFLIDSCLEIIKNQGAFATVFGSGYKGVSKHIAGYAGAHNDFLEIWVDYGLLGMIPFVAFIILIIVYYFKILKIKSLKHQLMQLWA